MVGSRASLTRKCTGFTTAGRWSCWIMNDAFDPLMDSDTEGESQDRTFRRPIEWRCGERTDVGAVRQINEDAVLVRTEIGLWAVADGMGGHEVGDVASRMIIDTLNQVSGNERLSDFVDGVEQSLLDVNRQILDYADLMFDKATMGS